MHVLSPFAIPCFVTSLAKFTPTFTNLSSSVTTEFIDISLAIILELLIRVSLISIGLIRARVTCILISSITSSSSSTVNLSKSAL